MPRSIERLGARSLPWVMVEERYFWVAILGLDIVLRRAGMRAECGQIEGKRRLETHARLYRRPHRYDPKLRQAIAKRVCFAGILKI